MPSRSNCENTAKRSAFISPQVCGKQHLIKDIRAVSVGWFYDTKTEGTDANDRCDVGAQTGGVLSR